ncbi:MAG: outer membrane beta-barrel protein [Gallionella sp.]|jgi:OOP family OmpA-OmpF porin
MKKSTMTIALAAALLSISVAQASEFSGGWIGAKVGSNRSDVAGAGTAAVPSYNAKSANTYGIEAGYNWDVSSFLLGIDGFADFNQKATHNRVPAALVNYGSDVYGLDAKLGLPSGNWLPYAKLGYGSARAKGGVLTGTYSGAHLGLGVEYKFASHWSVAGEYTTGSGKNNGAKLTNNNLTIGVNYYFDSPYVAPAAAVAAPVVAKEVVAPAPVAAAPQPAQRKAVFAADSSADSLFDFGKAVVKPSGKAAIDKFTADLKGADFEVIKVTGHTDRIGSKAFNLKLSTRRAEAVKAYMVESAGIPAGKIDAKGVDGSNPVTKSGECKGKKKTKKLIACLAPDRRVEVEVTATRTSK